MNVGERIEERLALLGKSQAWLARQIGVSQPAINKVIRNPNTGTKHLHDIARHLETNVDYLMGRTDDPQPGALSMPTQETIAELLGMQLIPEVDIAYSMGAGAVVDEYPDARLVPFRVDWLTRLTGGGAADVFLTRGLGDSMVPTILDGDDVLVNRAETAIRHQDRIWALGYGDLGMIKRVRRLPSGLFQLNSDNNAVTPIEATQDELHVVGRVIWIGRKV